MTLDTLLRRRDIWRGGQLSARPVHRLSTGFPELDASLPEGGWPQGALTEILALPKGIGELRLAIPALAQLSRENRWLAWIAPPFLPYAPALATRGIDLSRMLVVHVKAKTDALWAMEQALRYGRCGAVLAWPRQIDRRALRRLQLAAEAGQAWGFLFRPLNEASSPSPAALRLRLEPLAKGLAVHVLKCCGGMPFTLHLSLPLAPSQEHKG